MTEKLIERLREGEGTLAVLHEGKIHVYQDTPSMDALQVALHEEPEKLYHAKIATWDVDTDTARLIIESGADMVIAKQMAPEALCLLKEKGIGCEYRHLMAPEQV